MEADIEADYTLLAEEITFIEKCLEELHAGNKGILLEDLRVEVNKRHLRQKQQGSVASA